DLFLRGAPPLPDPALLRIPGAGRLPPARPLRIPFPDAGQVRDRRSRRLHPLPPARCPGGAARCRRGPAVSDFNQESLNVFLQEASEHLQFLREYSGILQDPLPRPEDVERLYIAAHTLSGTSASYGFPLFSEIAGRLAHVFQYARNASLGPETQGPLTEFLADAITVLEFDL